ncbi:MAG: GNAT family N-acetyltransferase, partial [Ruminiclostridium sp.]|nr:GNAT family N-acetyltransferase [Ruminiclostridium sp.]
MSISKKIRLATENDSVSLLKIYGEFITNTAITFEVNVPSVSEFSKRIKNVLEKLPWLTCEIDG